MSELVDAKGDTDLTAHNSDEHALSSAKTSLSESKNEKFTNFFTKRNPKDKEQGASYTANQHAQPNLSVSAAKLQQNSETTK